MRMGAIIMARRGSNSSWRTPSACLKQAAILLGFWACADMTPAGATLYAFDWTRGLDDNGVTKADGKAEYTADSGNITVSYISPIDSDRWVLPGSYNYASAEYGRLSAYSRTAAYMLETKPYNSAGQGGAHAGFTDTITLSTGTLGEAGTATFRIDYEAAGSSYISVLHSDFGQPVPYAGFMAESYFSVGSYWAAWDMGPYTTVSTSNSYLYSVNFISGVPVDIGLVLEVGSWWQGNGPGYAVSTAEASTARWGGLVSAIRSDGSTIRKSSLSLVAQSGTNYLARLGDGDAVPEPASWALMLLGFGATGAALRRSRGRAVTAL
jgi:hypothetical protein